MDRKEFLENNIIQIATAILNNETIIAGMAMSQKESNVEEWVEGIANLSFLITHALFKKI